MPFTPTGLLQGTLDVLILKVLTLEPMHGLGISRRIAQVTGETFQVKPGSLFPGVAPDGTGRVAGRSVGREREQPASQVLSA
jgi:hypothetical protein